MANALGGVVTRSILSVPELAAAQLMMTAILVGLIGILFVVIEEFSTRFSGSVRISSDGWTYLQQRMSYIP